MLLNSSIIIILLTMNFHRLSAQGNVTGPSWDRTGRDGKGWRSRPVSFCRFPGGQCLVPSNIWRTESHPVDTLVGLVPFCPISSSREGGVFPVNNDEQKLPSDRHGTGCLVPNGKACAVDHSTSLRRRMTKWFHEKVYGTTYPGFD